MLKKEKREKEREREKTIILIGRGEETDRVKYR